MNPRPLILFALVFSPMALGAVSAWQPFNGPTCTSDLTASPSADVNELENQLMHWPQLKYGGPADGKNLFELTKTIRRLSGRSVWAQSPYSTYMFGQSYPISVRLIKNGGADNQTVEDRDEVLSEAIDHGRTTGQNNYLDAVTIDGHQYVFDSNLVGQVFAFLSGRELRTGIGDRRWVKSDDKTMNIAVEANKVLPANLDRPLLVIRSYPDGKISFSSAGIFHAEGIEHEVVLEFGSINYYDAKEKISPLLNAQAPKEKKPSLWNRIWR